jgi:hypothetical protein
MPEPDMNASGQEKGRIIFPRTETSGADNG